jgi:Bacterial extracellular solute-binding protein
MGRHSVPDPDEAPDAPRAPHDDDAEGFSYDQPGYEHGYEAGPGHGEPGYANRDFAGDEHDDQTGYEQPGFDDSDYEETDYDEEGYEEPAPRQPGYEPNFWETDEPDYRYEEPDAPTHSFSANPPPRPPVTGRAHGGDWEGGEWTGSHRAVDPKRRGVSVGVIAALVTVVVVVGAIIGWRFFGDALTNRSHAGAARCVEGEVAVAVVADPSIADPLRAVADKYNQTAAPVGDRCVKVAVRPADSDAVVNGFVGAWPGELGERPALWIPGSSISEARLEAATGEQTVSDSRSLVTSPVVLAVRPQLKDALAQQNWSTLPALQTNPTSMDGLNLSGWGPLRLALPLTEDSDASYLAAEAVATTSAPPGAPATAGTPAVNTLMAGQPKLADSKVSTAFDALLQAGDPATAPVHAVVTTEQQLYQRGGSMPDAKGQLTPWLPPGPTAIADYPTVLLAGSWLSQEQVSAASEFARYLRGAEPMTELAKAGFRTDGGTPPKNDVTDLGSLAAPMSVGDNSMRATLANAVSGPPSAGPSTPSGAGAVSVMLDQTLNLSPVVTALKARVQALPPNAVVGLTAFNGSEGSTLVPVGPLADPVQGQPRSAALAAGLDGLASTTSGRVSFTTLRNVYTDAVTNFRAGQPNSVLIITSGPHTDQSLNGTGLQDTIRAAFDPAKKVAINVINVGDDPDRATWQAITEITGGQYQSVPASDSPDMVSNINDLLS